MGFKKTGRAPIIGAPFDAVQQTKQVCAACAQSGFKGTRCAHVEPKVADKATKR